MDNFHRDESGKSYTIVIIMLGLTIAAGAFLIAFITNQRAQTPKPYSNLRLSEIKIPTPPPVDPLIAPPEIFIQEASQAPEIAEEEQITTSPSLESVPSPSAAN